jgi:hypothetical protein
LEDNLYYRKNLLLYYRIEYPQFYSEKYKQNLIRINNYYKKEALELQEKAIKDNFKAAVSQYLYSLSRGYPVRQFELYHVYTMTLNAECTLSLYRDTYEYMGGAHGITVRNSESWDTENGRIIKLCEIFDHGVDYCDYIKNAVIEQIKIRIRRDKEMFFEDYIKNVSSNLNCNNFYLTPEGIMIYFQLYEISPYAEGIPQFLIPYNPEVMTIHKCC